MRWTHLVLILVSCLLCVALSASGNGTPASANPPVQPNPGPKCCHCKSGAGNPNGGKTATCPRKGATEPVPDKDAAAGKDADSTKTSLHRYFTKHTLVWAMVLCLAIILTVIALRIFLS